MGGIITAVGVSIQKYSESLELCSLASWFNEEQFLSFIKAHPLNPDTKVYIQVGQTRANDTDASFIDGKMNRQYIDCNLRYYNNFKMNHPIDNLVTNYRRRRHHELYWAFFQNS